MKRAPGVWGSREETKGKDNLLFLRPGGTERKDTGDKGGLEA